MPPVRVGICEDDAELRAALRDGLCREKLDVVEAATGADALRSFATRCPDALVLDIGLPDADGRDVCQALRARGLDCPVVFLSARDALPDRLSGFHAGGDDYLTKPFALAELVVRLRALLRRQGPGEATELADGLTLDPAAHALVAGDLDVALTPIEFRLLALLAARRGDVARRAELVSAGWADGSIVHDNTLDKYVAALRRKLRTAAGGATLETIRGVGYRLR